METREKIESLITTTVKIQPQDRLVEEPIIGEKYHLHWAHPGAVWRLINIIGNLGVLETPKTRRTLKANLKDLRLLSRYAHRNASERLRRETIEKVKSEIPDVVSIYLSNGCQLHGDRYWEIELPTEKISIPYNY